ncbi:TraR/DksA family transcriptional regulator [Mesorhizobium sp. A556]
MEPDPESLDDRFRSRIETELAELTCQSRATNADRSPVELDQQSVGRLSRMDALQVQAMAKAVERRRQARQVALEQALRRMRVGKFGYCLDCGEFVGLRRLEIDPAALKCVRCA